MLMITNDDGIDALGLEHLVEVLDASTTVFVIAPAKEQSASSHSLSLRDPIEVRECAPRKVTVDGTPADCVYIGLHHFFRDAPPAMVVSGINKGTNLGTDVHYSGTVAAAKEAALGGIRSLAVSLEHPPLAEAESTAHWNTAARVAARVIEGLSSLGTTAPLLWNLNVPNRPVSEIVGLRVCSPGHRYYASSVTELGDGRLRIGGAHQRFCDTPDTDGYWFHRGYAVLTPLSLTWAWRGRPLDSNTIDSLEGSFTRTGP